MDPWTPSADAPCSSPERPAGWAALPWVLAAASSTGLLPDGPVLVLDDTMVVEGPLGPLVDAADPLGAAARAVHRDGATGLGWGGCLPGALALSGTDAELLTWWRARWPSLTSPAADPLGELWGELPVGTAVTSSADPALRSTLMPVNDRWPLEDVLAECRKHYEKTNRRVYIEYVMLDGVNDHTIHAKQLAAVLQPHNAFKVNLIPYNPTGTGFGGSARTTIAAFKDTLQSEGVVATVRLTRGQDIAAACGQLVADAIQKAAVSDTDAALA